MDNHDKDRFERAGWRVGDVDEFLDLSPGELYFIETKMALAKSLKKLRKKRRMTQAGLARTLGTSQSRVAKMEAADPTVSIDLLLKALLAIGAMRKDLSAIISNGPYQGSVAGKSSGIIAETPSVEYSTQKQTMPPIHPGEIILEDFLVPLGITQKKFARHLGWSYSRLNEIINGKRRVTAESALCLSEAFGTTPQFWLYLQAGYDLEIAKQDHVKVKPLKTS